MPEPTDRDQPNPEPRNPSEHGGLLNDVGVSRRRLLQLGAVGAGALSLPGIIAACGGGDGTSAETSGGGGGASTESTESSELAALLDNIESKQVIVGNYGGDTEEVRRKVFWEPFEERTGVRVVSADAGALAVPMLLGEVPTKWDAVHGSITEAQTALESGEKKLPTTPEIAWEDLVLPARFQKYLFQSFVLGYVPATIEGNFDEEPASWEDFFDTKKFPGKRAWPAEYFTGGVMEAALLGDGVPPDEIYPLDFERATAKIASVFDDLVIYSEFPQSQSFLTSKTVSMSYAPNGLWHQLAAKGVPVQVIWSATPILTTNGMTILPEAPNLDAVEALAAFCNQPKLQAEFAEGTSYGPPTEEAFEDLSEEVVENLPNAPGRSPVLAVDEPYFAKNYAKIEEENARVFSEA